jgi:hypothetical protein
MVIIRESDSERGFSSIPPLGSATERQIYFHSIKWDGSFDEVKYFDEMLNLPVIESDSDSSSSSSTDSDSDCIIIPRSSFTGKELVLFDPSTTTMFTKSNPRGVIDYLCKFYFMVCFAFYMPLKC